MNPTATHEHMPGLKSVAVVYQGQYPVAGGLSAGTRRVRDIANGLAHNGVRVEMWTPAHFESVSGDDSDLFQHIRLGSSSSKPNSFGRQRFWSNVCREAKQKRPDFVIFYNTTIDSAQAFRNLNSQRILTAFELCDRHSTDAPNLPRKLVHLAAEWLLPKLSNLNIVISRCLNNWVQNVAPKVQSVIVPGLVDVATFQSQREWGQEFRKKFAISQDDFLVTYGGGWWRHKGLADLIEGFALFRKQTSGNVKLLISGNPRITDDMDDPRNIASEAGLDSSAIFPGDLGERDIVSMLIAADVVVSPSTDHPFSHNAFPTKVAEYAAMGKAIVATEVGDVPLYLTHQESAMLCKPNSPSSIAEKLHQLYSDRALLNRLESSAAKVACENFESAAAMKKLLQQLSLVHSQAT